MGASPRLLVGLGNPPSSYTFTRHNIGRRFIDALSVQSKTSYENDRQANLFRLPVFFGLPLEKPLLCVQLNSYMNQSGPSLKSLILREKIQMTEVLVVYDDFMLPFGTLRLRSKGSAGGHNGIKSILEAFGGEDQFGRLRIGIGPQPPGQDFADFVLEKFTKKEEEKIPLIFDAARDGLKVLLEFGAEKAMSQMNKQHVSME